MTADSLVILYTLTIAQMASTSTFMSMNSNHASQTMNSHSELTLGTYGQLQFIIAYFTVYLPGREVLISSKHIKNAQKRDNHKLL